MSPVRRSMRIIAFIEQLDVIEKILTHLGLWPAPAHSPPVLSVPTKATPEGRRRTIPAAPRGVAGRPNPGSVRRRRKANSYHLDKKG